MKMNVFQRREAIKAKLLDIINHISEKKIIEIPEHSSLADHLGVDSLDRMDLWLSIEETLKVDMPEKELRACNTVADLIDMVERHMKG